LFDDSLDPAVRGFLHSPANPNGDALILTHGAGSDCNFPLLVALGEALADMATPSCAAIFPFARSGEPARRFHAKRSVIAPACANAVAVMRKSGAGRIFSWRPFVWRAASDDAMCR